MRPACQIYAAGYKYIFIANDTFKQMIHTLTSRQTVNAPIEKVWDFFSDPDNLNLITPPSLHFHIRSGADVPISNGQIIHYRIRILPLVRVSWVTEIKEIVPLSTFTDEQRSGPYKLWIHHHQFVPTDQGVDIIDTVRYRIGFSMLGEILHVFWIKHQLAYIFRYRRKQIESLISDSIKANKQSGITIK